MSALAAETLPVPAPPDRRRPPPLQPPPLQPSPLQPSPLQLVPSDPRPAPRLRLRPAPESRPPVVRSGDPSIGWRPGERPEPTLFDAALDAPAPTARDRLRLVLTPGGCSPDPTAPDPLGWCRTLVPGLVEVLQRRRPLGQLSCWLSEPVLGAVTVSLRLRQRAGAAVPPRGRVRSVRVQCPTPLAAEVSVHVELPHRSVALACRLEAEPGGRWLCTALDLGDAHLLGTLT